MLTTNYPSIESKDRNQGYKRKAILAVLAIEAVFISAGLLYYLLG